MLCLTNGVWLPHAEWAPVSLTDHQHNHHAPFPPLSNHHQAAGFRRSHSRGLWSLGAHFLFQKRTLSHTHDFLYIPTYYLQPYFGPDDVRAHVHLRNIHLYSTYIIQGPYVWIHLSFGWFTTVRMSNLPQDYCLKSVQNLPNKNPDLQQIALASASLISLHWVSLWFSQCYFMSTLYFHLVNLSSYPLKRQESPPQHTLTRSITVSAVFERRSVACIRVRALVQWHHQMLQPAGVFPCCMVSHSHIHGFFLLIRMRQLVCVNNVW